MDNYQIFEELKNTNSLNNILGLPGEEKATIEDMYTMARIIQSVGGVINNHWVRTSDENKLDKKAGAVVLLKKGELALWYGGGSCLNNVYLSEKDKMPHLSTFSNGGTVYKGSVIPTDADICSYNKPFFDQNSCLSCTIVAYAPLYLKEDQA